MMEEFHCSSCGARLITDKTTIITRCVFCNSQEVIKQAYTGDFAPKKVLPFTVTKDDFLKIVQNHLSENKYVANEIKNNPIFQEVKGLYVPYYFANYDVRVYADGVSSSGGSEPYHKGFKIDFSEKALVSTDASIKLDDSIMESLKPYDYKKLVEFNPAYLANFQAELPSDSIEKIESRLENRIIKYCFNCISQDMPCPYHSSGTEIYDFDRTTDFECILLPVWFVSLDYNGDRYTFLVNGQTGKTIGEIPLGKKTKSKKNIYKAVIITSIIIAIVFIFVLLLGLLLKNMQGSEAIVGLTIFAGLFFSQLFIWVAIAFGIVLSNLNKKIKKIQGIRYFYDIPIESWDRVYKIHEPHEKVYRNQYRYQVSYTYSKGAWKKDYYRSSNVKFQRYKKGIYVKDVDVYEFDDLSRTNEKANFTKNNYNL